MALITRGIELYHKWDGAIPGGPALTGDNLDSTLGSRFYGLQEVGELSGMKGGATRDQIEVTTLADDEHVFVDGIKAQNEQSAITFKFLYDAKLFKLFQDISDQEQEYIVDGGRTNLGTYRVRIPLEAGAYATFAMKATITDLKVDAAAVNSALTMSMSLTPYEAITVTNSEAAVSE